MEGKDNIISLNRAFIDDPNLSLMEKGLMTILLSLDGNWDIDDITSRYRGFEDDFISTLSDLCMHGYMINRKGITYLSDKPQISWRLNEG